MGILSSIGGAVKKVVSKVASVVAPKPKIPSYTSATKPTGGAFTPAPANKAGMTVKNVAAATMPTGKATSATVLKAIDAGPTAAAKPSSSGGGSRIGSAVNKVVSKATEAASGFVNAAKSNTDVSGGFHLKQPSAMDALALTTGAPVGKVAAGVGKTASALLAKSDEELVKLAFSGARGDNLANKALDQLSPEKLKRLELLIKRSIAGPEGRAAAAALERLTETGMAFVNAKLMPAKVGAVSKVGQAAVNTKTAALTQSYILQLAQKLKSPFVVLGIVGSYLISSQLSFNDRGDAVTSAQVALNVAIKNKDAAGVAEMNSIIQEADSIATTLKSLIPLVNYPMAALNKIAVGAKAAAVMSRGAEVVKEINSKILNTPHDTAGQPQSAAGQNLFGLAEGPSAENQPTPETQFMKDTKERLRLQEESKARENTAYLEGVKAQLEMKMEYNAMINAAYYEAQKANDLERAEMYEDRLEKSYAQQQKILDFWDDYQDQKAQDQADYFDLKYAEWVKEQEYYAANYKNTERSHLNFGLLK